MKGLIVVAAAAVVAAGVAQRGLAAEEAPTLVQNMKGTIAPTAQAIWDVTNPAMGDDGMLDGKKLKPADWAKIDDAGRRLKAGSAPLLNPDQLKVAAPGQAPQDGADAGKIGRTIAGDRAGFTAAAQALARLGDDLAAAATARNAAKVGELAGGMDGVCEACHSRYWYPEQAAPGT